jgi:hypothetical protein
MNDEPWLTKRELAQRLKCSTRKVERLKLPSIRIGGQNRYFMSQVERALSAPADLPENVVALRPRHEEVAA